VDKTYILVVDTSTFQFLVTSCAIAFSKGSFSATVLQVGDKEKCIEPVFLRQYMCHVNQKYNERI
jgi:hypothetical protein